MEIAAGLHLVPGAYGANVCLVTGPEVALFDTGLPASGPAVLRYLEQVGLSARELQVIALTHADPRHAGAAPWLRRNTAARLYASSEEAAILAGQAPAGPVRQTWRWVLARFGQPVEACLVDGVLEPDDMVAGFRVIPTPGHTMGHIAFYREQDGVLIAGDAVRIAGADILAPNFWTSASEVRARISASHLAELSIHLLVPGHGPLYREPGAGLRRVGGPPGAVEQALQRRAARRAARMR